MEDWEIEDGMNTRGKRNSLRMGGYKMEDRKRKSPEREAGKGGRGRRAGEETLKEKIYGINKSEIEKSILHLHRCRGGDLL